MQLTSLSATRSLGFHAQEIGQAEAETGECASVQKITAFKPSQNSAGRSASSRNMSKFYKKRG